MKLVCTHRCFYKGSTKRPGDVVDIPKDELASDIVKSSFSSPEVAEAAGVEAVEPKDTSLTVAELKRRLEEMNVHFSARAKKSELEALYADQFSE